MHYLLFCYSGLLSFTFATPISQWSNEGALDQTSSLAQLSEDDTLDAADQISMGECNGSNSMEENDIDENPIIFRRQTDACPVEAPKEKKSPTPEKVPASNKSDNKCDDPERKVLVSCGGIAVIELGAASFDIEQWVLHCRKGKPLFIYSNDHE